jgi:hypothetical protein
VVVIVHGATQGQAAMEQDREPSPPSPSPLPPQGAAPSAAAPLGKEVPATKGVCCQLSPKASHVWIPVTQFLCGAANGHKLSAKFSTKGGQRCMQQALAMQAGPGGGQTEALHPPLAGGLGKATSPLGPSVFSSDKMGLRTTVLTSSGYCRTK